MNEHVMTLRAMRPNQVFRVDRRRLTLLARLRRWLTGPFRRRAR